LVIDEEILIHEVQMNSNINSLIQKLTQVHISPVLVGVEK